MLHQTDNWIYHTGCCETGVEDTGANVICVEVTKEFLAVSKTCGNDLNTSVPEVGFPGLQSLVPVRHALEGGARC